MPHQPSTSLINTICRLYNHLPRRRKVQLLFLLVLMLIGATAELVTIGAILPFLALMADPGKALDFPVLQQLFALLGWRQPNSILLPAAALFGIIAVLSGIIRVLLIWYGNRLTYAIGHDLAVDVYSRTLFQHYSYHIARNSSHIIAGLAKVQGVIFYLLAPLMTSIIAVVTSLAIFFALLIVDPVVAITASAGFVTLYTLITVFTKRRLQKNSEVLAGLQSSRVKAVQEGLGGIRDVLIDGSQSVYIERFQRIEAALTKAYVVNSTIGAAPRYLVESLGMLLITVLAYWLSQRDGGLVGALPVLGALAIGAQKMLPLMQQVYIGWATIMGSKGIIIDVVELIEQPIHPEYLAGQGVPMTFEDNITLKDVSFRYAETGRNVLKCLNLKITKGSRVGFIGETGSGKSTTLDLIMGLLEPTDGVILVDGTPLNSKNRRSWQSRIAHVPQTIYLSDASIAENIAFGVKNTDIDYARVREAARQASISDHVESMEKQYETEVGERGVRLSGGQRQRIGIARALYKQADVLILDEATSALDDTTELSVMNSIRDLGENLTIMIIAHRVSTLSKCDNIFKMSGGRLLSEGSYEQVIISPDVLI